MVALDLQVKLHPLVKIGVGEQRELLDSAFPLQAKLLRDESLKGISKMRFHDLDVTDDVSIKFLHLVGRDPEFLVLRSAHHVLFKLIDVFILYLELSHISSGLSAFGIPLRRDLAGILAKRHNVEVEVTNPLAHIAYDEKKFSGPIPENISTILTVATGLALRRI